MNLSTGEWFNELNEDECFHEEYGNVVKWKYIDYEQEGDMLWEILNGLMATW